MRRILPRYVKAYLLGAKNDANDAAAICEAVQRPNMRFVPHKSPDQTDIQCVHRIRQGYVKSRTALINQTRGLLAEYGIVIKQGICAMRNQLPALIAHEGNNLSGFMRQNLTSLYKSLCFLDEQILEQDIYVHHIPLCSSHALSCCHSLQGHVGNLYILPDIFCIYCI